MSETVEFTDRYDALGIPRPDPATVCSGQCEGSGWVPVYLSEADPHAHHARPVDETEPELVRLWRDAEQTKPTDDGWHFVQCPDCKGSGTR